MKTKLTWAGKPVTIEKLYSKKAAILKKRFELYICYDIVDAEIIKGLLNVLPTKTELKNILKEME